MQTRHAVSSDEFKRMSTEELRRHFLVEKLFTPGAIELLYWETDRTVVGGAVPTTAPLILPTDPPLAAEYFCERRELGLLNLGAPGEVTIDGNRYPLAPLDGLYIGRGSRNISFASAESANPAKFFLTSYPAHARFPIQVIPQSSAHRVELGSPATANKRTIFQYIHEGGAKSCQLVMGLTRLEPGSVWNTMPPHTHARRCEIYFYYTLPENAAVFHLMGPGDETRHLVMQNEQAALSPIWSIHSGCGTEAYSFIWAMGGENQRFIDMDGIAIRDLK
jgi:4-deoxy-L-threo-5-hexosulose-uronate ketol-isomerase